VHGVGERDEKQLRAGRRCGTPISRTFFFFFFSISAVTGIQDSSMAFFPILCGLFFITQGPFLLLPQIYNFFYDDN